MHPTVGSTWTTPVVAPTAACNRLGLDRVFLQQRRALVMRVRRSAAGESTVRLSGDNRSCSISFAYHQTAD